MKRLSLLYLSALLIASSISNVSIAQVQDSAEVKTNSPGNTFYFYFINGYALAYKFYNSGNSDLRLRLDLSSSYSDAKSNRDNEYINPKPDKYSYENTITSSFNNFTAEFAYSYNFYRSHLSQAYAGLGPFISYNRIKQESTGKGVYPSSSSGYNQADKTLSHGFSAGLSAFIGLEAFLTQSLRVFAETQITGGRTWSKMETNYDYTSSQSSPPRTTSASSDKVNSWFYNLTSVRIGLGISI
ncbi:MAG TPA: hypothetical protein VHO03_20900 [Ignavibacteriales bacterium]|nr:hypothetical protein [Ignavibacteriales bacterium]